MIDKKELWEKVREVANVMIDKYIAPACKMENDIFPDMYVTSIHDCQPIDIEADAIAMKILEHFKLEMSDAHLFINVQIAGFALYILEHSDYLDKKE